MINEALIIVSDAKKKDLEKMQSLKVKYLLGKNELPYYFDPATGIKK